MRACFCITNFEILEQNLYTSLNNFSKKNPFCGRLLAPLVASANATMVLTASVLCSIEGLAFAAINLFGALLKREMYSLSDALDLFEIGIYQLTTTVGVVVFLPFKFIYELFNIIINPQTASSRHQGNYTIQKIEEMRIDPTNNFRPLFRVLEAEDANGSEADELPKTEKHLKPVT